MAVTLKGDVGGSSKFCRAGFDVSYFVGRRHGRLRRVNGRFDLHEDVFLTVCFDVG